MAKKQDDDATRATASEDTSGDEGQDTSAETTEAPAGGDADDGSDEGGEQGGGTSAELLRELEELRAERAERQRQDAAREAESARARESGTEHRGNPPSQPAMSPEEQALANDIMDLGRRAQAIDADIAMLEKNDPLAKGLVLQRDTVRASMRAMALSFRKLQDEMYEFRLPEDIREDFRKFREANRHRVADMDILRDAFEGQLSRANKTRLKAREKQAAEIIEAKDRGVVATGRREVTATDAKTKTKEMSGAAFDAKYERLQAEGDLQGALAMSNAVRNGTLIVKD